MDKQEIAARLLVIQHQLDSIQTELRILFQDVLDSEQGDEVD